ncbi:hypothetical protein LOZ80_06165 [Paenibacillus sp. HWE-109]|uniref:hypothetical protein n=1 Tax=Paenibacillus sp. HWE-109 TaxID=1306526 RepID=UPI001EE10052|nr:hypothetical protein [Paenibacillus sp. HWE-109]UKS28517.1 hypothetical protein LOZ80_06165 [Paenibacillus sp. HWE-109]
MLASVADFFATAVFVSQGSNELYDAYRRENGYFGDVMNWIDVIEQNVGGKVIVCL